MKTRIITREEVETKVLATVAESGAFDTEAMEILSSGGIWNGEKMSALVSINSASIRIEIAGKESHESNVSVNGRWYHDEEASKENGTTIFANLSIEIGYQVARIKEPIEALAFANRLQLAAKITDRLQTVFEGIQYRYGDDFR